MPRLRWAAVRLALVTMTVASVSAAAAQPVTVLHNGTTIRVDDTLPDPDDLWTSPGDLTRINGFVLKPEGACLDELCIPIRQDRDSDLLITRGGRKWFNVTELARKLEQPFKADHDTRVWSFGQIPLKREAFATGGVAPDFAMKDRKGNTVRLSDFRGKKVLLLTWASW